MSMTKKDYTALAAIIKAAMDKAKTFAPLPVRKDPLDSLRSHFVQGWCGATHDIADAIGDYCAQNGFTFDKAAFMRNAGIDQC